MAPVLFSKLASIRRCGALYHFPNAHVTTQYHRSVSPCTIHVLPTLFKPRNSVSSKTLITSRKRGLSTPTAGLIDSFVTTSTLSLALLCTAGQVVKMIRVQSELEAYKSVPVDPSTNLRWGVMGVVSFLPLFNWMSWILAALDSEEGGTIYYLLAALYAVPLLRNGFDQDLYSLTMLGLGIAHIQLARISETEPDTVLPLTAPRFVGRAVLGLQRRLALLPRAIRIAEELQEFEDDEKSREFFNRIERKGMREFDEKLGGPKDGGSKK